MRLDNNDKVYRVGKKYKRDFINNGWLGKKIIKPVVSAFNIFSGGFNPFVSLGVMAIGWLFARSMKPDVPDFGTNDFEETERGILVNKQSNNACVPVIYGERLVGGTRVFIETSGTDNTYLMLL